MPTARDEIKVGDEYIDVSIEFEVFCEECGAGICINTNYIRKSRNNFTTFCHRCKKEKDELEKERDELLAHIESLEIQIKELETA